MWMFVCVYASVCVTYRHIIIIILATDTLCNIPALTHKSICGINKNERETRNLLLSPQRNHLLSYYHRHNSRRCCCCYCCCCCHYHHRRRQQHDLSILLIYIIWEWNTWFSFKPHFDVVIWFCLVLSTCGTLRFVFLLLCL